MRAAKYRGRTGLNVSEGYARHPVRTHLVTDVDEAIAVVARYATPLPPETVLVAVSERMVAITEGRSYPNE